MNTDILPIHRAAHQKGAALYVVLVVALLSMLLVLWASRSARFNEIATGNDSDHQRAFEAAQAMVRDAEFDIRSERPDGKACTETANASCRTLAVSVSDKKAHYPVAGELDLNTTLIETLDAQTPSCIAGICTPTHIERADFWESPTQLAKMKLSAAHYGQYTGATVTAEGNPVLHHDASTPARAWYWVELLPYNVSAATGDAGFAGSYKPDNDSPFVYRITAIAEGMKPGTRAIVQSILILRKVSS